MSIKRDESITIKEPPSREECEIYFEGMREDDIESFPDEEEVYQQGGSLKDNVISETYSYNEIPLNID
jgi:hypothetical protein